MTIEARKYFLTTHNCGVPLVAPIKRYRMAATTPQKNLSAVNGSITLLLANGAGFSKEIWEPFVYDIFRLNESRGAAQVSLREVWSVDSPNHGEGCTINEDILAKNPGIASIWDYAEAFECLYKSGLLGPLDSKDHQVVLCGHSAGSVAVTLTTSFFNPPSQVPFSSVILVDPPMAARRTFGQDSQMYKMVEATTPVRRDHWESKDSASQWMRGRLPWKAWDERVFKNFINYGLRQLPTAFYPEEDAGGGVTLATHRLEEYYAFTGKMFTYDATDRLSQICQHLPVHLVYGGRNDMFERAVQDTLPDQIEGRVFASITRLRGVGHLVPQEAPEPLASAILDILSKPQLAVEPKTKM